MRSEERFTPAIKSAEVPQGGEEQEVRKRSLCKNRISPVKVLIHHLFTESLSTHSLLKKEEKKSRYIRKAGETENPVCRTSRLTRLLFHSCPSKSRVLTCIVAQVALPLSHRFFGYVTLHLQIRVILQPTIVNWLLPPALDTGWCLLQNQL